MIFMKKNKQLDPQNKFVFNTPPTAERSNITSDWGVDCHEAKSLLNIVNFDVRLSLAAISNYSRELLEKHDETLNENCKENMFRIIEETINLNSRLDSIMNSQHKVQPNKQKIVVDLGEMAKVIIYGLMCTTPERSVKFILALDVMAEGDAGLLQIVLKYLLSNAWNSTAHKDDALIEFGKAELARETAFFVRDNGIAYDLSDAEDLFDHLTSNQLPKGDGIGLNIVKSIIHRHNGRVWAEGNAGPGTTLFFTLQ
jgi:light-regulated signal transduction histidine kinase (bacteriophytochrome)